MKELGCTGVMVPEIGVGTWRYRGGVEPLRRAVDLGANLVDTAEMYGTEDVVGQAMEGIRDRVFLATKVSGAHLRHDQVMRAAEASLQRLGVSVIDLYQIHWPESSVPIKETMRAMETLVDRGMVRYVGVSNFSVESMIEAQQAMEKCPIVANQVRYSLQDRNVERDLLPYCESNRVTVIAYSPLAKGGLLRGSSFRRDGGKKVLDQVAAEQGKTVAQVALNWCISHPAVIAIPKSDSVARTEENCAASGWALTSDQISRLDSAF